MRKETFKKVFRGVCIAVLIAMLFSFVPQGVTADEHTTAPSLGGKLLATILSYELASIGGLSQLLFTFMQYTVNPQVGVISNTWKIVRDFCNIFFILIMIVMAFGTIFDIGNYKLTPDLITRLIIVAVLINFSLVISGLFITGMDTINSVFLKAVGDPGARIQQALKPAQIIGGDGTSFLGSIGAIAAQNGCFLATATGGVGGVLAYQTKCYDAIATASGLPSDSQVWAVTLRLFFTVLLVGIVLFGLLGATFFAIIRIPFLWFLLIFSPMAAFASILPATRDGWNRWLKEFIAWNTYLPIYLVVLYFGLYLLSQRNDVLSGLNRIPGQFLTSPILGFGFTPEEIFFYVLVGFVLWGGTAFALSVSRSSGGMATDIGAKWSRAAAGFVFRAPVTIASKTRLGDYYEGVKEGGAASFKKIRQEGIPSPFSDKKYFGALKGDARRANVAQIFGAIGAAEAQKKDAVKYYKEQQEKRGLAGNDLRNITRSSTAKIEERLAAYENLKEDKALSGEDMVEAYKLYLDQKMPLAAQRFGTQIEFDKLNKEERKMFFDPANVQDPEIRKKVAQAMGEKGEFKDLKQLEEATTLFATNNARTEFLKKVAEKNVIDAFMAGARQDLLKNKEGETISFDEALEGEVKRRKGKDFAGLLSNDLIKTNDEILKDPKLKDKASQLIKLRDLIRQRLKESPDLEANLRKNQETNSEQLRVLDVLGNKGKGGGPNTPSTPGSASPVRADISRENTINLRET